MQLCELHQRQGHKCRQQDGCFKKNTSWISTEVEKKKCVRVPLLVNNACTWCCWCRTCMRCTFYVQRKAHVCVVVLSIMTEDVTWRWKSSFLFSVHKKYSRSFVKLRLNHWCHVDYFTNVLAKFLGLKTFLLRCCLWRFRKLLDFIKKILICVLKMNEGFTGLERHEGE